MASGLADNVVLATYLSARCPVFVSPAMDLDMYHHPTTQQNLQTLKDHGVRIIPVEFGELASGLVGEGRMAEPETIFQFLNDHLEVEGELSGKKILITAGPTQEAIDPVRYIGNRSSGKMGIALAHECAKRGAVVDLVLGPTHLDGSGENISLHKVESAADMLEACKARFEQCDVAIMAAAVADYRPSESANQKIKKSAEDKGLRIDLVETTDIAATLGKKKNQLSCLLVLHLRQMTVSLMPVIN